MKNRVTIQAVSRLSDGQGGYAESWVDGATVWASIEPYSGYQKFQAMQLQTPVTHKISMRYRPDVATGTRLKYGDRFFSVEEALNVNEEGRFLAIKAVERVVRAEAVDVGALLLETGAYLRLNGGGRILLGA
ncbi:phage head closure protein [Zavarzinella formosa]|uniref:phage head closure protein n=1 Tax=Zavarzinella formosa TaxID=360055 RepID=UPI0003068D81|nr:phage head closure protein [Zavarzinella formosa]